MFFDVSATVTYVDHAECIAAMAYAHKFRPILAHGSFVYEHHVSLLRLE